MIPGPLRAEVDDLESALGRIAVRMYRETGQRERATLMRDLVRTRGAIDQLLDGRVIAPGDLRSLRKRAEG